MNFRLKSLVVGVPGLLFAATRILAADLPAASTSSSDLTASFFRLIGGLVLVFALFFGGVWLVRNSSRFQLKRGPAPRLTIVETRLLGNRQALHVVAYDSRRYLIGSSPAGVQLISQLADESAPTDGSSRPASSFADVLQATWSARGG